VNRPVGAYARRVPERERVEIAVVGGGLLGLATARELVRRGHEVVVLERATVGHDRGGSHGPSRIFRLGYADPKYVPMAMAALVLWRELEDESGLELLHPTGQLSFGAGLDQLFETLRAEGAPARWLRENEIRARRDDIAIEGRALLESGSGVLAADRCLDALRAGAGNSVHETERVERVVDAGDHVLVETATTTWTADVAVVCAGPWSRVLLEGVVTLPTFTTLEHVAYFRYRTSDPATLPIVIAYGEPAAYGLPTPSLGLYKMALHHVGARIDAEASPRAADSHAVARIEAAVERWLPVLDPTAVRVDTCIYDTTPDEDFVLDRRGRIVIGAGTSGHGFKFGPLFGELLADLATGTAPPCSLAPFAASRFASG
jgi:sarcosine oxidase